MSKLNMCGLILLQALHQLRELLGFVEVVYCL